MCPFTGRGQSRVLSNGCRSRTSRLQNCARDHCRLATSMEAFFLMRQNASDQPARPCSALWLGATIGFISLLLTWPSLINGGPFFMSDTISYIRGAASAFYKIFGVKTAWTSEYLRVFGDPGQHSAIATSTVTAEAPVTLSGRSVYYGALPFAADLAGSFWIVVAVQSAIASAAVVLTVRNIARIVGKEPRWELVGIATAVAFVTPLGYFTGYLMPDVFGGLAILATANLLFPDPRESRVTFSFWLGLLAYALVVHNANPPIVFLMSIAAIICSRLQKFKLKPLRLALTYLCLCLAILAQVAFAQSVLTYTGAAPVAPPFLAARLIADGPGYTYLQSHCSGEKYIYCRTLREGRLPSDILLWDEDPNRSLFRGLSPQEQRLSAAEQSKYVIRVAKEYPFWVLATAAENSLRQLFDFSLAEFNYGDTARMRFNETIPAQMLRPLLATRAYRNVMPINPAQTIAAISALLSLVIFAAFLLRRGGQNMENAKLVRGYCVTILAGIASNAMICGAISGPNGRYEMRVIWILPLVAAAVFMVRARNRREPIAAVAQPDFPRADQARASMGAVS